MHKRLLFFASCFFFLVAALLNACKREYSNEGRAGLDSIQVVVLPPHPASFTLVGAPGDCSSTVINGTYTAGINLSSSNSVTVKVNVSAPGAYVIKTDTVNGISFSASGSFNTTGNVDVVLVASGRPNVAGRFYFVPNTSTSSCAFSIAVQNRPPWATYVLESGGGNPSPCLYRVFGSYRANAPLVFSDSVTVRVFVTIPGNFTVQTNKVNGFDFAYTGTFTTTGSQDITLHGLGTPQAAGNFVFTPQIVGPAPLGGQACAFNLTVQ